MSRRQGPPVHQNKFAWKPNLGRKINETEPGGRFRPLSEITGVCTRCKEQIDWKRRYGKYKPILEPTKCQKCRKRNVRQAYHNLCTGCAHENGICAKCCCKVDQIVGRDISEIEQEQKALEETLKNAREREKRTILRSVNKGNTSSSCTPKIADRSREGDLFSARSIDEYAQTARQDDVEDESEDEDDDEVEDEDEEN